MSGKLLRIMSIAACLAPSMALSLQLPIPQVTRQGARSLPPPVTTTIPAKTLSLHQSILLALRNNPTVKSSQIQRIVDRYQVMLAKHVFRPQYQLHLSQTLDHDAKPRYQLSPGVQIKTPMGAEIGVNYADDLTGHSGATTLSWKQPLLRGFGAVNKIPYADAMANDQVAQLNYHENVAAVINGVVLAYRNLVKDYNNITIQKDFLKASSASLQRYKLRVKVGKMAPSDILQQSASYESTKLSYVQQKNALQQDYQQFLSAIGLVPEAKLKIQRHIAVSDFPLPRQQQAIDRTLTGNIAYRQALIQLQSTRRAIQAAKDQRKWQLNMTASTTLNSAGHTRSGPALLFDLDIPIDNLQGRANEVSARVALEQAQLALKQKKDNLVRQVMTRLRTIRSDWAQIKVAGDGVHLQSETLKAAQLRLKYGRSTVFEVTQVQNTLLQQNMALVAAKMTYLNDITALYDLWGGTLKKWHIQLRE
jgi:outer membrane protein